MTRIGSGKWMSGTVTWATLALALSGCGGSTADLSSTDSGASTPVDGAAPVDGVAIPVDGTSAGDSAAPFNPGMLGGFLGANGDGGSAAVGDAGTNPQVVDGCTRLCTEEAAAACPAAGSLQSCIVGCQLVVGNPGCATQAQDLFSCVDGKTATCDSSGNATFAGCGAMELESEACFLQNATDPTLQMPCAAYCANVAAAKCPNDDPTGCLSSCPVVGNLISGCGASWKNYVTCAGTATFACGSDGKAAPAGCASQVLTFLGCAAAGIAPLVTDAGQ